MPTVPSNDLKVMVCIVIIVFNRGVGVTACNQRDVSFGNDPPPSESTRIYKHCGVTNIFNCGCANPYLEVESHSVGTPSI